MTNPQPTPPPGPVPAQNGLCPPSPYGGPKYNQYPPGSGLCYPDNAVPPWPHGDKPIQKEPGELGPPPIPHKGPYTEWPPGSGKWWEDKRPLPPGSTIPAGMKSPGDDTYPSTGDPAIDEAIRQTFTNLRDIRDAHGTGQTPINGRFFTDAAQVVQGIQDGVQDVGRAAASHWTGESGAIYQRITQQLST